MKKDTLCGFRGAPPPPSEFRGGVPPLDFFKVIIPKAFDLEQNINDHRQVGQARKNGDAPKERIYIFYAPLLLP